MIYNKNYYKKIFILLLLSLLPAISCSQAAKDSNVSGTNSSASTVLVKRVIDGDTIVLNDGRKIRYIGMDTPEFSIKEQKKYAEIAYNENENLVEGKYVRLEYDSTLMDIYGRTLAYVFVDNIMVNKELVERGYALVLTLPPNTFYYHNFINAQKKARDNRAGFWNDSTFLTIDYTEAEKFIGELCAVEGKVLEIKEKDKIILFYFGNDKNNFKIVIYKTNIRLFKNEGKYPLTYYSGKNIKTFGRIKNYNGPEIEVDNPFQIETIEQ